MTVASSVTLAVSLIVIFAAVAETRRYRRARQWRHQRPSPQPMPSWPVSPKRSRRGALEQARQEVMLANERAEEAVRLRRDAEQSVRLHLEATARLTADMEATTAARVASAEARLAELHTTFSARIEELERNLRDSKSGAQVGWPLLLARVERQWADVVNASADERSVVNGTHGEQLAQAVQRDLERLREEAGVVATFHRSEPVEGGDPLTTLLAVGEAVGLLAYHSEHVLVELSDPTVVSGQDWTGGDNGQRRLEQLAAMASDAGLSATVNVVDYVAQVVLGMPKTNIVSGSPRPHEPTRRAKHR